MSDELLANKLLSGNMYVEDSCVISIEGDKITYRHYYMDRSFSLSRITTENKSKLFATELEAYKHLAELLKDSIKDLKQEFKEQLSELENRNSELQHEVYELIDKVNELERD